MSGVVLEQIQPVVEIERGALCFVSEIRNCKVPKKDRYRGFQLFGKDDEAYRQMAQQ